MRWTLLALCLPLTFAHAGKIYVCKDAQGNTLYSQTPCPEQYNTKEERTYEATALDESVAQDRAVMADEVSRNNDRLQAERDIKNTEKAIRRLEKERDSMLEEQRRLADSLGGANARSRAEDIYKQAMKKQAEYDLKIEKQVEALKGAHSRLTESRKSSVSTSEDNEAR